MKQCTWKNVENVCINNRSRYNGNHGDHTCHYGKHSIIIGTWNLIVFFTGKVLYMSVRLGRGIKLISLTENNVNCKNLLLLFNLLNLARDEFINNY